MVPFRSLLSLLLALALLPACKPGTSEATKETGVTYRTTGSIERLAPELDQLIPADAQLEVLASGFDWSEGPLWLPSENRLIFSDVPQNRIYVWAEGDTTATVYLEPSGYTGAVSRGGEPGANGLTLDRQGRLLLCQHGDRRIARMEAPLSASAASFATLVDRYQDKRFNSPNDVIVDSKGTIYFTDPPYGLEGNMDDPAKELLFQGIYRLSTDGAVTLLDTLSRPNGIALSPDERRLYVANSDPDRPIWMVWDLTGEGVANGRVFFDATPLMSAGPGLPDGMKVDRNGNLFATGPGGVLVFSPEGKHLGTIRTGQATANCAFNPDQTALYITADSLLLRLRLGEGK